MKIKLMSLLTGAVVLGFAATPFVVKAVTPSSAPQILAQARTGQSRLGDLNLTQSQKDQMRRIHERTQEKIKAVLTPEQRRQYESAMENRSFGRFNSNGSGNLSARGQGQGGRRFNNPMASLNLSQDQQNQIRQIKRTAREQMNSVLTDAQRAQLQQNRPSRMRNSGNFGQYNYNQYNQYDQ